MNVAPSFGDTLIYYNGTGSGTTVTNLGSLGAAGNGTVQTAGSGTVGFVGTGGAFGSGDSFFNLANSASNGARIVVPINALPGLTSSSWSLTGWFKRTNNTTNDTIFHIGTGDGFGTEEELYLYGPGGADTAVVQNFNPSDVAMGQPASLGTWHFFALTFAASGLNDGKGTLSYYLNDLAPLTDNTFTLEFTAPFHLGGVGYAPTQSADRDFLGGLDEFAFYNEVLNSSQIAGLYAGTATPLTVPEPSTAITLLGGLALFGQLRRSRR